ncbi:hypothetical protein [Neomegalonema perideroedes]|uniref:hypothetical protein n=1 Tax=Neomegalonema perideroedes TaxID=217219 RepID=UPI0012FDD20B|nr:hypothetical protein [Neomegalonema perideroedes]
MTPARPAIFKRAALAAIAAALLAPPALAEEAPAASPTVAQEEAAASPAPLVCGAATIYSEASTEPGTLIHSAAFDAHWIEALFAAGCQQTQIGCNSCSQTASGKTICGAADCAVSAPAAVAASCSWEIADFKCRVWRDDSRVHEGGWASDALRARPVYVQAD